MPTIHTELSSPEQEAAQFFRQKDEGVIAEVIQLRCAAQSYAWGRPAERSEVAFLAQSAGEAIDNSKRYAELWMGTHPSGPSYVKESGETLREWIEAHPEALGDKVDRLGLCFRSMLQLSTSRSPRHEVRTLNCMSTHYR